MCKNLPILDLPNKEDDLVLETDPSNEYGIENQRKRKTLQIL